MMLREHCLVEFLTRSLGVRCYGLYIDPSATNKVEAMPDLSRLLA